MFAQTPATTLERLEDFWRRREAATRHETHYEAYGYPVHFEANDERLLAAAHLSAGRYSRCAPVPGGPTIHLKFVVDGRMPAEAVPLDWPSRLRYLGFDRWLTISGDPWVNAFAHLDQWVGVGVISSTLAEEPRLLSRYIADCFVLNMLLRTGWGQLHASCLEKEGQALLLAAPPNSGKSTTAFHLTMNGYRLLSDGMTYVRADGQEMELLGYPVGEVKLRFDMLSAFPQVKGRGQAAWAREDRKMVFDLRREMPDRVVETAIRPWRLVLCLLTREEGAVASRAERVGAEEAFAALLPEALHLDERQIVERNLVSIRQMLTKTVCYRLHLGSDVQSLLNTVAQL